MMYADRLALDLTELGMENLAKELDPRLMIIQDHWGYRKSSNIVRKRLGHDQSTSGRHRTPSKGRSHQSRRLDRTA